MRTTDGGLSFEFRSGIVPPGDPYRAALAAGSLPFTCRGSDNGLAIEGGSTIGY